MSPLRSLTAAALSLTPGAAFAQRLGQATETDIYWFRFVAALLFCLVLAAGAALALRVRMRGALPLMRASPSRVQLVETLRLSHQVDICLVSCDDLQVLLAATPQGALLLNVSRAPTSTSPPA